MSVHSLPEATKKRIAGKQHYKCANKPGSNLKGLEGYDCLCWGNKDVDNRGAFDESGYEIDHIIEFCISQDDSDTNLQALCISCHKVKSKRFMSIDENRKYYKSKKIKVNEYSSEVFEEFTKEELTETKKATDVMLLDKIYKYFIIWHNWKDKESKEYPTKKDLKTYLLETRKLKFAESKFYYLKRRDKNGDVILEFINEVLEETQNEDDVMTLDNIYKYFSNWVKQSGKTRKKCPDRKELKTYLIEKRELKFADNKYYGIKMKDTGDAEEFEGEL